VSLGDPPRAFARAWWWPVAAWLSIAPLVACAPSLNWRQMDLADADGLRLRFPCKPARAERSLRLEGLAEPLRMVMWSCEAAGATWVLSAARVASVTEVSTALRALSAATQANLAWADRRARNQAPGPTPDQALLSSQQPAQQPAQPPWRQADAGAVDVPGMTPNPDARGWRIQGLKPDGAHGVRPLAVDAWHFSHGLTVFQAAIWRGDEPLPRQNGEDAVEVFRQSLQFPG
jgi:hypothetical protein